MYKRIAGTLFPVVAIALVAVGFWGYQENKEKNSILIKAENQYQRAFHDLNFYVDSLHDEIGKSIAVNSRQQLTPCLANTWRLASSAQNSVGQLPLTLMPFTKTEEFLAKISDFTYRVAIRDLDKEPLTDAEYKTLKSLYAYSKDVKKELSGVQTKVINKNLRWMDVELTLADEDKTEDNSIVDGFTSMEKTVEGYSEIDWGKDLTNKEDRKKGKYARLKGDKINASQAKAKISSFLGIGSKNNIRVEKVGKGIDELEYQSYSATIGSPKSSARTSIDITEVGGNVIWMLNDRTVNTKKLSDSQALAKANEFLKKHGLDSMEVVNYDTYQNVNVYQMVYRQGDILVYPDKVTVQVAMDNGEIVGFESADYLFNHRDRDLSDMKLSEADAKKQVNKNVKVTDVNKTLIANELGEEVLCYEVEGKVDDTAYRLYIDANTGDEVKCEIIKNPTL